MSHQRILTEREYYQISKPCFYFASQIPKKQEAKPLITISAFTIQNMSLCSTKMHFITFFYAFFEAYYYRILTIRKKCGIGNLRLRAEIFRFPTEILSFEIPIAFFDGFLRPQKTNKNKNLSVWDTFLLGR